MDATHLKCPPLFDEDDKDKDMIVSTRIRVGRNLEDYPLGPGLTKE
jgi:protein-arginine kinase